ncbi:MAG: hypothetical protein ACREE4_15835 [Stellaceae bacterium]
MPWKALQREFGYGRSRLWVLWRAAKDVHEHPQACGNPITGESVNDTRSESIVPRHEIRKSPADPRGVRHLPQPGAVDAPGKGWEVSAPGTAVAAALVLGSALPSRAAVIGVTVGTAPSQVLAAPTNAPHHLIEIQNEVTGTTAIACTFGSGTPALNSAGSYTIPAGGTMVWNGALYRS